MSSSPLRVPPSLLGFILFFSAMTVIGALVDVLVDLLAHLLCDLTPI
jgi:hypothetical protein